jgi:hypothetical protein
MSRTSAYRSLTYLLGVALRHRPAAQRATLHPHSPIKNAENKNEFVGFSISTRCATKNGARNTGNNWK